jgi:hypothetical protein
VPNENKKEMHFFDAHGILQLATNASRIPKNAASFHRELDG